MANDKNYNIPNIHCSAQYFSMLTELHRIKPVSRVMLRQKTEEANRLTQPEL
jgi:hypothetical protein